MRQARPDTGGKTRLVHSSDSECRRPLNDRQADPASRESVARAPGAELERSAGVTCEAVVKMLCSTCVAGDLLGPRNHPGGHYEEREGPHGFLKSGPHAVWRAAAVGGLSNQNTSAAPLAQARTVGEAPAMDAELEFNRLWGQEVFSGSGTPLAGLAEGRARMERVDRLQRAAAETLCRAAGSVRYQLLCAGWDGDDHGSVGD